MACCWVAGMAISMADEWGNRWVCYGVTVSVAMWAGRLDLYEAVMKEV